MDAAKATVTSAHVASSVFALDQRTGDTVDISGTGNETFANGKTTTLLLSIRSGKQRGVVLVADGSVYARPEHPSNSARPWVKVDFTATHLDPSVSAIVVGFSDLAIVGSPSYVSGLRPAASVVRVRAPVSAHGVRSTDYPFYIDPTKVQFGRGIIKQLTQPVAMEADVLLDDSGRVFALHQQQDVGPTSFETQTTYTKYNARVVINAPPADQVAS